MKLPLPEWWDDTAALAAFVAPQMPQQPRDWLFMPWHKWHPPFTGLPEPREREAIAAARQGNFKLLAELLDPTKPTKPKQPLPSHRPERLSAEAEVLIAAKLRGEHKVPRQRPTQTEAQRRAYNPAYAAADEVPIIQEILLRHFPGRRGYKRRAIEIAALRAGVDSDGVREHLRPKRRRNKDGV
jgi:hypothetical protein